AHAATCSAEVARASGSADPAGWAEAAGAWRRAGQPYPAAYAQWRRGEALLAAGGARAEAREALAEPFAAAAALGAAPLAREVEALARRARIQLEPAPAAVEAQRGGELPGGLTQRELEVLRLLADGLTNRQIAGRLFISQKTAGVHVSHLLAKLSAPNRVA